MFLHQEYLKRHNIDIDWTAFPSQGTLVFKSANPEHNKWVLINFIKEGPDYHPQTYRINTIVPMRNQGHNNNGGISGFTKKHKINWDQLEKWISEFIVKAHKLKIVKDSYEKKIALWEIFLFCNDRLVANCNLQDKRLLFKTLDRSLSYEERSKNLDEVIRDCNNNNQDYNLGYMFETSLSQYSNDDWINRGLISQ